MTPGEARGPSDAVVRVATASDAPALLELRAVMFEAMGTPAAAIADPRWRQAAHDWFVQRVAHPDTRIVVAQVGGACVSAAVGEVTPLIPGPNTVTGSVGLISNVATSSGYRGRGLASACTDDLLRWFAQETDVRRVDLFATEAGARLYLRRGFTRRGFEAMCLPVPR
jgi:GNAT superfamily N-acetyltransferase